MCVSGNFPLIFPLQITSEIKRVIRKRKKKIHKIYWSVSVELVLVFWSCSNLLVYFRCWEGIFSNSTETESTAEVTQERENVLRESASSCDCLHSSMSLISVGEWMSFPLWDPDGIPRASLKNKGDVLPVTSILGLPE